MEIYLMQHGLALSEAEDPERPLSSAGRDQIETSAGAIRKMGLRFDAVVASTKKRSRQTAEIIAEAVGYPGESIVETESVKPSASPETALEYLAQFNDRNSVFIAGHLPSLTKLASSLLAKDSEVSIQFRNGGLCRIDAERLPAHNAVLQWCLTPDQLRVVFASQD